MRARLAALDPAAHGEASATACSRLVNLEEFRHAGVVMLYMPLPGELDVTPVALRCFQTGKTVCVPRVDWKRREMAAIEVTSFDDRTMDVDRHGLRTPKEGAPVPPELIDLLVVPGLAFDTRGYRLGRGGGYYDRFLRRLRRSATAIGPALDLQIIDEVPTDDRDVSVDMIVTERRVVHCGTRARH
jgi:5-formyltetrahydrofolate cyclo-ligase